MVFFSKNNGSGAISGKFPAMSETDKAVASGNMAEMVRILEAQKPVKKTRGVMTAGRALSDALPSHNILNPYGVLV